MMIKAKTRNRYVELGGRSGFNGSALGDNGLQVECALEGSVMWLKIAAVGKLSDLMCMRDVVEN